MSKKNKIEMLEETLDRKLTVAEMYANRPRKWLLYTAIVLIIAVLIGWSATTSTYRPHRHRYRGRQRASSTASSIRIPI